MQLVIEDKEPGHDADATWSVSKGNDGHIGAFSLMAFTPKPGNVKPNGAKPQATGDVMNSAVHTVSIDQQSKNYNITGTESYVWIASSGSKVPLQCRPDE